MYKQGSKLGDWILEESLSENELYSTFKAKQANSSSWAVIKIITSDKFNDGHFEKVKEEQNKLPEMFRLSEEKAGDKYLFYRSFEETSVEVYLSNHRPRAGKAVHLMQEVLDSLIVLDKANISPALLVAKEEIPDFPPTPSFAKLVKI